MGELRETRKAFREMKKDVPYKWHNFNKTSLFFGWALSLAALGGLLIWGVGCSTARGEELHFEDDVTITIEGPSTITIEHEPSYGSYMFMFEREDAEPTAEEKEAEYQQCLNYNIIHSKPAHKKQC